MDFSYVFLKNNWNLAILAKKIIKYINIIITPKIHFWFKHCVVSQKLACFIENKLLVLKLFWSNQNLVDNFFKVKLGFVGTVPKLDVLFNELELLLFFNVRLRATGDRWSISFSIGDQYDTESAITFCARYRSSWNLNVENILIF